MPRPVGRWRGILAARGNTLEPVGTLTKRLLPLTHWLGAHAARNIEHGQAKTRLICTLAGLCGFGVLALTGDLPAGIVGMAVVFPLYAVGYAVHLRRHPAPTRARRGLAVVLDNLAASYIAFFGGGYAAYVGFNFLVTMGWALRFGRHYLFLSTAFAILGTACNLALSPYWKDNLLFGTSIIFALVATAINAAILLGRIAEANRLLALQMEEVARLAWQDPVTKLSNRLHFQERLSQALAAAERGARRVGLLMFDLDGFKSVNDTLGHDAGDRLLREVALRVGRRLRQADTFARFGGDEFVVLMEVVHDHSDAVRVAESVNRVVADIDLFPGTGVRVTASIGIALCAPRAGEPCEAEGFLRQVDAAMYEAKRAGKGRYRLAAGSLGQQPDDAPCG
jgi:diguanylate cyclase (GGDEF)-like protein